MQFIRWETPSQKSQLFGGKANYGIGGSEESIRDTMRINDDGSLRIPNVNREKHQGMYPLHRIGKNCGNLYPMNLNNKVKYTKKANKKLD